ncbi:MAG: DUF2555 domain-containing protein [Prochlorothrix sp.]|nr:DUF2555 domain-containing protein [Prochlorothrix sp.]
MSPDASTPTTTPALTPDAIAQVTADEVAQLAERLETDNYSSAFESLQDWHLLRAIAFQRPELAEPYLYLLDLEDFDES